MISLPRSPCDYVSWGPDVEQMILRQVTSYCPPKDCFSNVLCRGRAALYVFTLRRGLATSSFIQLVAFFYGRGLRIK